MQETIRLKMLLENICITSCRESNTGPLVIDTIYVVDPFPNLNGMGSSSILSIGHVLSPMGSCCYHNFDHIVMYKCRRLFALQCC